ncbi:hypothetical protein TIFTF001_020974 [Ficus carica]|uniref:Uncharacterized protein n=1 Tax=Ficus carica TaxID=3494 RepID=A0AA88ABS6_FICCA|nr:hypothetical protein TIFTF001_020974 [Ficus carica]
MRSGIPTNARQSLRRRSPAKWKHLGMMGTPVWCLPWALRCLSVLSGPGCSGRPGRVGCLGYPVDRATPAAGEVYDQCQIMGGLPRLDLEVGAGLFLADSFRVLRVVATQV